MAETSAIVRSLPGGHPLTPLFETNPDGFTLSALSRYVCHFS
ncbi:MAG: hypothetical protein ACPG3X_03840 [Opitutales bacterium]